MSVPYAIRKVFGPYHREFSPTQDAAALRMQLRSGEIWGRRASWGGEPWVKGKAGPLPLDRRGIEFWAFTPPDYPHGPRPRWDTANDWVTVDEQSDTVKLQVAFVRVTQLFHD